MTVILISLALSLLIVSAVGVAMFVSVAFRGPAFATSTAAAGDLLRPPPVKGVELLRWAAAAAEATTRNWLKGRRSGRSAVELATEIQEGATFAIEHSQRAETFGKRVSCPAYCYSMIALTPPEALSVANYVCATTTPDDAKRIRDRAASNTSKTRQMSHDEYLSAHVRCPLMNGDDVCVAFPVRPLRCRGWTPRSHVPAESVDPRHADGTAAETLAEVPRAHLLACGMERGFSKGLTSAGLDGELYELNSALVAAFDTPHAAERWAQGERVFHNCKRYEYSTPHTADPSP